MSWNPFAEDIQNPIKKLIHALSNFEENTPIFEHIFKYVMHELQTGESVFYITKKEIDENVESLSDKFMFHGFLRQSADIKSLHEKYLSNNVNKEEMKTRLGMMKLLFSLSESPTNFFAKMPADFKYYEVKEEEEIDWGSYLREGIEEWNPSAYSDSDEWTDEEETNVYNESACVRSPAEVTQVNFRFGDRSPEIPKADEHKKEWDLAMKSVQSGWFNRNFIFMKPESEHPEANVAILWDKHLLQSGLSFGNPTNIISEYKMVREVIWQLWEPHNSMIYKFSGNQLVPKDDITISSCRPEALQTFLWEFIPYIEMLQEFRAFEVKVTNQEFSSTETLKSYAEALKNILSKGIEGVVELEQKIIAQEETMTLLKLASFFEQNFKTAKALLKIHRNNVKILESDGNEYRLLVALHVGMLRAYSKSEQDIYLSIYLESLYKFVNVIDTWLSRGNLENSYNEFPIINSNVDEDVHSADWKMRFSVKELPEEILNDGFFQVIINEVLQIGKNIHLLKLFGKLHLVNQLNNSVSLHDELIVRVIASIETYFDATKAIELPDLVASCRVNEGGDVYRFPAMCSDFCKYTTEMDRLENLVDVSDSFLMSAYRSFYVTEDEAQTESKTPKLHERISLITQRIFPAQQIIENTFREILKERYGASGRVVKSLLFSEHKLETHLKLLSNIFLFEDDVIFPFYRKLFEKIDKGGKWGNDIWLTSHLQDILMDIYPEHYDRVNVLVKDAWRDFLNDPLKACSMLRLHYELNWPVNVIISKQNLILYKDLFDFILQIKWALFTLNHLHFADIERKKVKGKTGKAVRILQMRLKVLRFGLINLFSSMQHYVLGFVFNKCRAQFAEDLDLAHDWDTLISAHSKFISDLHKVATNLRDKEENNYGFYYLLYVVRYLWLMWKDLREVELRSLEKYENGYKICYENLTEFILPTESF